MGIGFGVTSGILTVLGIMFEVLGDVGSGAYYWGWIAIALNGLFAIFALIFN